MCSFSYRELNIYFQHGRCIHANKSEKIHNDYCNYCNENMFYVMKTFYRNTLCFI